jgi:hypothetical protein
VNNSILERVTMLDALRIAGIPAPNKSGFTRCPFHDDAKPSLHLVGTKGRETGFKCFGCGAAGGILDFLVEARIAIDHAHAAQILEERMGEARPQPRVVASFWYDDGTETIVARVDRIEPGRDGRAKDFLPYAAIGNNFAQKPGLNGLQMPLYRRSDVLLAGRDGGTIFLVEGEGKADQLREALRESRTVAAVTTIAHGANAPIRGDHVADFTGAKRVVVLPDSDAAGRTAADRRARSIAAAHPSTEVRIVDLFPDRIDGVDVADWLREGHGVVELRRLTALSTSVAADAPDPDEPSADSAEQLTLSTIDAADLLVRPYAPPRFLVEHLIPECAIALLSADTGAGKSSFLLHAALSIAFAMPVASRFGVAAQTAPLLYLNGEMSSDVLARFLHANAAGIGVDVSDLPRGRLLFEGRSGLTDFFTVRSGRVQDQRGPHRLPVAARPSGTFRLLDRRRAPYPQALAGFQSGARARQWQPRPDRRGRRARGPSIARRPAGKLYPDRQDAYALRWRQRGHGVAAKGVVARWRTPVIDIRSWRANTAKCDPNRDRAARDPRRARGSRSKDHRGARGQRRKPKTSTRVAP